MSIATQIKAFFKESLKNKDQLKLEAIRLLISDIKNLEIQKKGSKKPDVIDQDVVKIIQKQLKQYKESIQQYVSSQRSAEAEEDLKKTEILKSFLPEPVSSEKLSIIISESIFNLKAKGLKDQGVVIQEVQSKTMGAVDGVKIVDMVRQQLSQL